MKLPIIGQGIGPSAITAREAVNVMFEPRPQGEKAAYVAKALQIEPTNLKALVLAGKISVDKISSLNLALLQGSKFTGSVNAANEGGGVKTYGGGAIFTSRILGNTASSRATGLRAGRFVRRSPALA